MHNPLLDFTALPRFAAIRAEHVAPAIEILIADGNAPIERFATADRAPTWEEFVEPLDDANEKLARAWSQVSHLNAVMNSPPIRDAYNAALPKVTRFYTGQGQDQRLHAGFKAIAASPAFADFSRARKRFVENQLRDFRLGGAELPPPQKEPFLHVLGYGSYADVSLASKMAGTPAQALAFLEDLARRTKPFAERDMRELREFARAELNLADVRACDVPYVSEKLRQQRYSFSDEEVKQYFPEEEVLAGMFRVVETIYGVRVRPGTAGTWHKDVRFYEIGDAGGEGIGQFVLGLYAREAKRGGAWMAEAIGRRRLGNRVQTPVAFLTCNFSAPVGGKPALFRHSEVNTLVHEFGHGLHQLLTQVDEMGVAGVHCAEWDAVEPTSPVIEKV